MTSTDKIQLLYLTYFNRAADQSGLDYWQGRLDAGETLGTIREALANPDVPEVKALYAETNTTEDYISVVYQNLLNREPDPTGLSYWSERVQEAVEQGVPLESAGLDILAAFMDAAQGNTGVDASTLSAKLTLANAITEATSDSPELVGELSAQYLADASIGMLDEQALASLGDSIINGKQSDSGGSSGPLPTLTVSLDELTSDDLVAANLNADNRSFLFEDNVAAQSNTRIDNFGADDSLLLIGIEADDVRVQVSGDNTQIQFDDANGHVSQIELVGVSGFFTSVGEFNQSTAYGDIQFA